MKKKISEKDILTVLAADKKVRRKRELDKDWAEFVAQQEKKKASRKRIGKYIKYAVAASVSLLLAIGMYWWMSSPTALPPKPNTPIALAAYYENLPNAPKPTDLSIKLSTENNPRPEKNKKEKMKEIAIAYNNDDYAIAIDLINQYFPTQIDNKILQARAVSYYKTKKYPKAITDFKILKTKQAETPIDDALWFLALSYLKTTPIQVDKAEETLKDLIRIYDSKDKIAQALLNDLSNF